MGSGPEGMRGNASSVVQNPTPQRTTHLKRNSWVNCKGKHPSFHKEFNAKRNRLGLKPLPMNRNKPHTGQPKAKQKGRANQPQHSLLEEQQDTLDVGLSNKELSNIMRAIFITL